MQKVLADAQIGASIAVNGTLLDGGHAHSRQPLPPILLPKHCSEPISAILRGSAVNLERPLAANARLDGHFVLGHVDGTAELVSLER